MYQWISNLVNSKRGMATVRARSAEAAVVMERYQCGRTQGDKLVFSAIDKENLRNQIKKELNIDPCSVHKLPADRIETAKHHDNEKLANKAVSHDHVLINSPSGVLHLNNNTIDLQSAQIPSAGIMSLGSKISQIDHTAIVVVENLAIMQLCGSFKLPLLCHDALWIYRGDHKSGSRVDACYDLIKRLGNNKDLIVFSDMDPKGIEIALSIANANYWLGPEMSEWENCLASQYASRSGYDLQGVEMKYLLKQKHTQPEPIKILIEQMANYRSSYRQEHMFSHNIPLSLHKLERTLVRP